MGQHEMFFELSTSCHLDGAHDPSNSMWDLLGAIGRDGKWLCGPVVALPNSIEFPRVSCLDHSQFIMIGVCHDYLYTTQDVGFLSRASSTSSAKWSAVMTGKSSWIS